MTPKGKYYQELEPFGTFHTIIHYLTHAPVPTYDDPSKRLHATILHVDAPLQGLGLLARS